jgi:ABC-type polysaccharide/polyol phosphate export permease
MRARLTEAPTLQALSQTQVGLSDVVASAGSWRIWWMFARNDIARRYRRSSLGPFWLTLSMGVMVLGLGIVYSTIFQTDLRSYLPFLAASLVFWAFMSSTVIETCGAFAEGEDVIRQMDLPKYIFVQRIVVRNLMVLLHNIVIIPITMLILWAPPGEWVILSVLGVLITVANLTWFGAVLALVSIRFRDVPMIVQNVMQLGFFITPVMFRPTQLGYDHPLVALNPFAALLDLMRGPLLGTIPPVSSYVVMIVLAIVGWFVALWSIGRFAPRVVYWL